MAVIQHEVWTCDFCGKAIGDRSAGLKGRLELRKPGARGTARRVEICLHALCETKLTKHATRL